MAQPEKKFQQGCVSVAIFAHESKLAGSPPRMSVAPQRSYKDKDGNWQNTSSFGTNDLPKLIVALSKAYDYLTCKVGTE